MKFGRMHRPVPRRYLLYGIVLGLLLFFAGAGLFFLWFKPVPKELAVAGSSAEQGARYGEELGSRMKLLVRVYLDGIVCQNKPDLIKKRRSQALGSLKYWPAAYRDELEALANTSQIDTGALAYANSFLDLGRGQAGCRSAVIVSSNLFLHAHNLDWDNLGGLGRWSTCIIRRRPSDGRLATVSVGFPGIIGALDIINEKGLALSFNQLGIGRGEVTEPVFIMIRRIAENAVSLEEARREILNAPAGMPFIITVSDAANGTGAVFERQRDRITERPIALGWVAACNVSQGSQGGSTPLDRLLKAKTIATPADLQNVLAHPDVLLACNIYSVVFDFRNNQLSLASGAIPAAPTHFRRFPLFPRGS